MFFNDICICHLAHGVLMPVLHPSTIIWSAGAYGACWRVYAVGISTGVENGVFVLITITVDDDLSRRRSPALDCKLMACALEGKWADYTATVVWSSHCMMLV
jgi:hypothetical protein